MVEKLKRKLFSNAGVGETVLISVAASLLVSFIVGGIVTWGNAQAQREKLDALICTVNEIKLDVKAGRAETAIIRTDLETHKAATAQGMQSGVSVEDIRAMMRRELEDQARRQKKVKTWQEIPESRAVPEKKEGAMYYLFPYPSTVATTIHPGNK